MPHLSFNRDAAAVQPQTVDLVPAPTDWEPDTELSVRERVEQRLKKEGIVGGSKRACRHPLPQLAFQGPLLTRLLVTTVQDVGPESEIPQYAPLGSKENEEALRDMGVTAKTRDAAWAAMDDDMTIAEALQDPKFAQLLKTAGKCPRTPQHSSMFRDVCLRDCLVYSGPGDC